MPVFAQLRLPDGREVTACPGDIVGRLASAKVCLNDPRISEAHALVSMRGRTLRLLALRGRFAVDDEASNDVELMADQVIQFARGIEVTVVAVVLGDVLGIEGPLMPTQVLPPIASLFAEGPSAGAVVPGLQSGADALLWLAGETLHLRITGQPDTTISPGETFTLPIAGGSAQVYRVTNVARPDVSSTDRGTSFEPLRIVLRFDTVHIHRGEQSIAIDGLPARLVTEIGLMGVPVEWRTVARAVWPEDAGAIDDAMLRQRWDRVLRRVRLRLRDAGMRADLVRMDGLGRVELLLGQHDRVEDQT